MLNDDLLRAHDVKAVSPKEWKKALRYVAYWLTYMLKDRTETGAFSEAVLGCNAVEYFTQRAYQKLFSGSWKWNENLSLTLQLIRIVKSDMSHHIRDWRKNNEPEVKAMGELSQEQCYYVEWESKQLSDLELAEQLEEELKVQQQLKDDAYAIAEAAAHDDPVLLKYIKAVKELNNYRAISKRLKLPMREVKTLEARLLDMLKQASYR